MSRQHHYIKCETEYFQAIEGKPLSIVEHWSRTHRHPQGEFIDNRRVSDLLSTISEKRQLDFFKKWAKKRLEEEYLAYDITSVSSYSELNGMVRYGYNQTYVPLSASQAAFS